MTRYNGLTWPRYFIPDALCTTYHHTLTLYRLLDLSPYVYWQINWFKFDATCFQILDFFLMMTPFLGSTISLVILFTLFIVLLEIEGKITAVEDPSPPVDDHFFILFPTPLSWTYCFIAPPCRSRSIGLIWNHLTTTLTTYIFYFLLHIPLQRLIAPL